MVCWAGPWGNEIDLATPERPEQVIRLLERAGLPAIPTGLAHGTVSTIANGRHFEITTLRRDVACDGRHAEVEFTDDFAADAARRDLTINAMSCDRAGRLYDYFGGRADLARAGCASSATPRRASPRTTCASSASSASSPATAGRRRMPRRSPPVPPPRPELRRLSGERIQAEMTKLLAAADPLPALRLMVETGVLGHVIPVRSPSRAWPGCSRWLRTATPWSGSPRCCARRPPIPTLPSRSPSAGVWRNREAAGCLP